MLEIHHSMDTISYTGEQLQAGWAAARFGLRRDADVAVAFVGPCDVDPRYMVDLEDLASGRRIFSKEMVHFIIEHLVPDLDRAILRQRILVFIVAEYLNARLGEHPISRRGNDLYDADRKLSVSIATTSKRSSLIHYGINVRASDFPLPVKGIADYGIQPHDFAEEILNRYRAEMAGVERAAGKVRRVPSWRDGVH